MKTFGKTALAVAMTLALAAPALAQQGKGFGRGGGGGGAMLLTNKGVQKELKVTEEQASKLEVFARETQQKNREEMQKLGDLSQEERRAKMQELAPAHHAALMKGLGEILEPKQVARFEQIQLQQAGAMAFSTPRVQEKLKLTADQKTKIREIGEESGTAMRGVFQEFQNDREGAMKKMAELRKESANKIQAVLTDDQKKTWKEMTGEPYEVRFEPRPGA